MISNGKTAIGWMPTNKKSMYQWVYIEESLCDYYNKNRHAEDLL